MNSIGFLLFCLLGTVAWAEEEPIAFQVFTFNDTSYAVGLYNKVRDTTIKQSELTYDPLLG